MDAIDRFWHCLGGPLPATDKDNNIFYKFNAAQDIKGIVKGK